MKKVSAFFGLLANTIGACIGLAMLVSGIRWLTMLSAAGWAPGYGILLFVFWILLGTYVLAFNTSRSLEHLFICLGRYDLAELQLKRHIALFARIGLSTWYWKLQLADYYCEQGKYNDAEAALISANASKTLFPQSRKGIETMSQPKFARVYIGQERFTEAQFILTKLSERRRKNLISKYFSEYRFAGGVNEMYIELLKKTNCFSEARQFEESTIKPLVLFENGNLNIQIFSVLIVLIYLSFCVVFFSAAGGGILKMGLWPSMADIYIWRAFSTSGESGIADCNRALKQDPNHAVAYLRRAEIYKNQRKLDLAVTDLTKAIKLIDVGSIVSLDCFEERANCYLKLGQWDNAIADYTDALDTRLVLATFPYFGKSKYILGDYFARAYAYAHINEYSKAVQDLNQVIEIDPKYVAAYSSRAKAYEKLGQLDLAEEDRRTASWLQQDD